MWDLPGPGIKPVSPALAGGFFTTEPPGKPLLVGVVNILYQAKEISLYSYFVKRFVYSFHGRLF